MVTFNSEELYIYVCGVWGPEAWVCRSGLYSFFSQGHHSYKVYFVCIYNTYAVILRIGTITVRGGGHIK